MWWDAFEKPQVTISAGSRSSTSVNERSLFSDPFLSLEQEFSPHNARESKEETRSAITMSGGKFHDFDGWEGFCAARDAYHPRTHEGKSLLFVKSLT